MRTMAQIHSTPRTRRLARRTSTVTNFTFIPSFWLERQSEVGLDLATTLLDVGWGDWLPDYGYFLSQRYNLRIDDSKITINMTLDDEGNKTVFLVTGHFDSKESDIFMAYDGDRMKQAYGLTPYGLKLDEVVDIYR